jgi:WD40 repeat protein
LAVSPDGKYLAEGIEEDDSIYVWDLSAHTLIKKLGQFGVITSAQFSHDGKLFATGSSEAAVTMWNAADGSFSPAGMGFHTDGGASYIEFNPTDTVLAVGDSKGVVFLFDLGNNTEVARLRHAGEAPSLSFSPDGARLAVVSQKGINLWDMTAIPFITKDKLVETACSYLIRNFTISEWKNLFSDKPYHLICPNLPAGKK